MGGRQSTNQQVMTRRQGSRPTQEAVDGGDAPAGLRAALATAERGPQSRKTCPEHGKGPCKKCMDSSKTASGVLCCRKGCPDEHNWQPGGVQRWYNSFCQKVKLCQAHRLPPCQACWRRDDSAALCCNYGHHREPNINLCLQHGGGACRNCQEENVSGQECCYRRHEGHPWSAADLNVLDIHYRHFQEP